MIVPLNTLLMLMLHQFPFKPSRASDERKIAKGTLNELNIIEFIDGINVFPIPLNPPCVKISMHIKS